MKNTMALLIFCCALTMASKAQNLVGAWESYHKLDSGEELKTVYIFSEHYQSIMFGENALKKDKTDQDINKTTGTDMVGWSSDNPCNQSRKQNTIE